MTQEQRPGSHDTQPHGLRLSAEELLAEQGRQLAAMREIAVALGTTLDLDELLQLVMRHVTELMDADRSTLYLVDHAHQEMWSKVLQGERMLEIRMALGQGLAGWVAQHGEPLNIDDAYTDPRFNARVDRQTGYRTQSVLALPVTNARGTVLGVVQVLNKRHGGTFSSSDQDLLQALAKQMAVAIENATLLADALQSNQALRAAHDELSRKIEELDLLFEVEQAMNQATSMDDLLAKVLARTMAVVGADAGSVLLEAPDSDDLVFTIALGRRGAAVKRVRLCRGQGIAGWVVEHSEPVVVPDPTQDPRHLAHLSEQVGFHPRNILCVPLPGQNRPLGAIELLNKQNGQAFGDDDLRLATLIAAQVAKGLQAARERESREKRTRLASIGQMLSSIVHDFKTPMTAIGGYVELMAMTDAEPERQRQCEVVFKQIDRLQSMIQELLMFARGQTEVLLHKVYLDRFVQQLNESLQPQFADSACDLHIDLRYMGTAYIDADKILRVLQNIARNAIEALAPGGGTFTLQIDREGDYLVLRCIDTGPGVPDEIAGQLFESFATHGKADGTGLGLAIAKKIVDEHHGSIEYSSLPGEGTTFVVQLPLELGGGHNRS